MTTETEQIKLSVEAKDTTAWDQIVKSKSYIGIQVELVNRIYNVGERENNTVMFDWLEKYSAEYREALSRTAEEDPKSILEFEQEDKERQEQVIEKVKKRIEAIHQMEIQIIRDLNPGGDFELDFSTWHKKYGKKFLRLIHDDFSILDKFEETKDTHPKEQEELLKEIETKLYN